jgi:sugar diacid utilization regulator
MAGAGTSFRGLGGFAASYSDARRALRHASGARPLVFVSDILLFDELTTPGGGDAARLIPDATRRMLADTASRATVEAYFAADLNVAVAAKALSLHPNSLRYRLRRIAEVTGRDPRTLAGLLELIAAARLDVPPAGRRDWSV